MLPAQLFRDRRMTLASQGSGPNQRGHPIHRPASVQRDDLSVEFLSSNAQNGAALSPQERFAANLRQARVEAGISQEELGYRCELHRTEISLLERAGREPRLATLLKLAGALDTTVGKLADGIVWDAERRRFEVKRPPRSQG